MTVATDYLNRRLDIDNKRACSNCGTVRDHGDFERDRTGLLICFFCPCEGCGRDLISRDERETGICDDCKRDADEAAEGCLAGVA